MAAEGAVLRNLPAAAAIILAAGAATRMGSPKQLLPFGSGTLLTHAAAQALAAEFVPVVVVLGANAGSIAPTLAGLPVELAHNPDWELGMGSSIRAGLRQLGDRLAGLTAVAVMLADQPRVLGHHLMAMRRLQDTGKVLALAAEYEGQRGVPAIFGSALFDALQALPPASGARHLLRQSGLPITGYPLPEAAVDVDTPADFASLEPVRTWS